MIQRSKEANLFEYGMHLELRIILNARMHLDFTLLKKLPFLYLCRTFNYDIFHII